MPLILLPGPLAANGDKQEIPLLQDSATPNRMSFDQGTPQICSEDPNEGGLPPRRADMNQVHYMLSNNFFELQKGSFYTFDVFMTQAPNTGYPNEAILWDYNTNQFLQSNKDNNTDNFVTTPSFIGVSWMPFLATSSLNGLMSAADKTKLNGIQAGAQVNTVTSVNGQTGNVNINILNIMQITTLGEGSFVVPEGVSKLYISMSGGGGGGANNQSYGSGGSGAGSCLKVPLSVIPGQIIPYFVGAGGAPRVSGEASYFGNYICNGGVHATTEGQRFAGGTCVGFPTGAMAVQGGYGGGGAGGSFSGGGAGGGTLFGAGATHGGGAAAAVDGQGYGSGGSGGSGNTGNGAGAPGFIMIEW